jgi:hypothetical protein
MEMKVAALSCGTGGILVKVVVGFLIIMRECLMLMAEGLLISM